MNLQLQLSIRCLLQREEYFLSADFNERVIIEKIVHETQSKDKCSQLGQIFGDVTNIVALEMVQVAKEQVFACYVALHPSKATLEEEGSAIKLPNNPTQMIAHGMRTYPSGRHLCDALALECTSEEEASASTMRREKLGADFQKLIEVVSKMTLPETLEQRWLWNGNSDTMKLSCRLIT